MGYGRMHALYSVLIPSAAMTREGGGFPLRRVACGIQYLSWGIRRTRSPLCADQTTRLPAGRKGGGVVMRLLMGVAIAMIATGALAQTTSTNCTRIGSQLLCNSYL